MPCCASTSATSTLSLPSTPRPQNETEFRGFGTCAAPPRLLAAPPRLLAFGGTVTSYGV